MKIDTDENGNVTISAKQYLEMFQAQADLDFLLMIGVDNWSGFSLPPRMDDYETLEEYGKALEEALESEW